MTPALGLALFAALHSSPSVREHTLRPLFAREAKAHHLSLRLLVAVAFRESTFRVDARSGHGDLGVMQIRRGCATRGYDRLSDAQLMEPAVNVHLGASRLSLARAKCHGAPARRWLSGYAGLACRPSTYSAHVLAMVAAR